MDDVVIAGGGPAGALAALLLARAGARVRVFERARFPRDKLCGDTLNPGALAIVAGHLPLEPLLDRSRPITGMRLTGPGGVHVTGHYAGETCGRAIRRRDLDQWLLGAAAAAGAQVDEEAAVAGAIADRSAAVHVRGVTVRAAGGPPRAHPARMTIAADGRRSILAFGLGMASQPAWPRRWAIGGYFESVGGLTDCGEMHVRRGHYIGVAPLPDGLANACLVVPRDGRRRAAGWTEPSERLVSALAADPELSPRFAGAHLVGHPVVLGPMAVDVPVPGVAGLLIAGDAAGFIDPITGDGLRFALRGAELAAEIALEVLAGALSPADAPVRLAARRRAAFGPKWRFNRALRRLVASPGGIRVAATSARVLPGIFERVIRYAGDQS